MLTSIIASIGASIGSQVVNYLKTHKEEVQFEKMQGEILEGWVYKITVAIRDEHRRNDVPLTVHNAVMDKVMEVVKNEFDSTKL